MTIRQLLVRRGDWTLFRNISLRQTLCLEGLVKSLLKEIILIRFSSILTSSQFVVGLSAFMSAILLLPLLPLCPWFRGPFSPGSAVSSFVIPGLVVQGSVSLSFPPDRGSGFLPQKYFFVLDILLSICLLTSAITEI